MTVPEAPQPRPRWYEEPRIVLSMVAALVALTALLAPDTIAGRTGDARLSTLSTEPQGAQLFAEVAQRLGWQIERRRTPELTAGPQNIQAVLDPALPLRRSEAHALLEHVRAGGGLLLVLGRGDPVADSLHITTGPALVFPRARDDTTACTRRTAGFVPLWPDNRVRLSSLRWKAQAPENITTFVEIAADSATRTAAIGFPYGRGRIVVGSDPDLLRNDVLRACAYGLDVPAIRMLEYLREGGLEPRRRIIFDEYHQGFGLQPGTLRTIGAYLRGTLSGRLLFQLMLAGIVMLVALAPRTVAPRESGVIERRSPLEHVEALARAYEQVGATRTATLRLLHGLRRRVDRGARASGRESDEQFLSRVAGATPAVTADIALIRRGLAKRLPRREFGAVGEALHRLELTLTRT